MSARAFQCVDDFRQPIALAALTHPCNAAPIGSAVLLLLMSGLFACALAVVGLDLAAILIALRVTALRERVSRRAMRNARRRAAERLGMASQCEWRCLENVAARARTRPRRRHDIDELLDRFLDVSLAHAHAMSWNEAMAAECPLRPGTESARSRQRADARRRSERALATLRDQLDVMAELIRLECERTVADECEAAAELWLTEVGDASSARRLLGDDRAGYATREPATAE